MEKIRKVLKTRNNLKYIIAAVLVMGLVGIVGVNAFAVASPLQFKVAGSVKTSMTLATPVTMDATTAKDDLFTYELNDASLAKKDIVWKLTSNSVIAVFGNNTDTIYGSDLTDDKLGINIKSAGVAIVNGQPRKLNADTNSLESDGIESANLKIISPLSVDLSASSRGGAATTITSTSQSGVNVLDNQIDPDATSYLNFKTNAAYSNLTVLINNTAYTVKNAATVSTDEITYNNGTVSIPTAILKAGISTISIQTSDIASADSSTEQASLKKDYRINVKPIFLKSAISSSTTVAETDSNKLMLRGSEYYYAFSEGVIKGGNNQLDLSKISNIASNPADYSVTITAATPVENDICDVNNAIISANEVGLTTISVKVAGSEDLKFNVAVPYTQYTNYDKTMTIGDSTTINTTGGRKDQTTVVDPYVSISWPTVTAIKSGTTTIKATMDLANYEKNNTKVYSASDIAILTAIYNKAYDQPMQSNFTFHIIDALTISTDSAKVNIGDTIDITVTTTDSSDITPVIEKLGEYIYATGEVDITTEKVSDSNPNIYKYVIHVTGKKAGQVKLVVHQKINGEDSHKDCVIEVVQPIEDITFSELPDIYIEDEATNLTAYFNPASDRIKKVEWYSDDESIATVTGLTTIDPSENKKIALVNASVKGIKQGRTDIHLRVYYTDGATTKDAHLSVNVKSHIDSITLNEKEVDGKKDGSFQLLATVKYKDGTTTINDGVTYTQTSFGDDPVVSVDPVTGLVKFLKPGKATVVATVSDSVDKKEAKCYFNIEVPITDITLDHTDVQITIGETISIKAIITPSDATNQTVTWETSNESVATVEESAKNDSINVKVTGVAHGTATIICKAADGQIRMCTVYVKQPVTGITLDSQETITIRKGQSIYLNATILPYNADDKTVVWSSSRPEYCTVDQYGMITGIEPTGENYEAVITVTSNDNPEIFATCRVKVIQPITGITLNSTYQEMWVGSKYAIIPDIQPADADNKKVTYISSDPEVASVDENGIVTALKGGTTVIEITTEQYGLKATCTILVKEYVTSITLDASEKYLGLGKTDKLTATVEAATATNRNVVWSSSDPDICSVDQQGNITGNNLGNAVITATAADGSGVVATCIVHVTESINGLRVEPDTVRIAIGSSYIVSAITDDGNVTNDVVWTSSNESIATVDEMGEIFGLSTGKCKVTATAKTDSMVSASCWVYVTPVVNISSLKINSSEIYMLTGKQRQLAVRVRPAVNTDSYDWYSTDTGIVTVNGSGLITTVGPGIADVVVESTNNGVSSACTVHSLAISRSNMRLEQYDSNVLDVIGIESGDKVTWRSSNPRIATVDASGNVIGRMRGTCNITAVTHDKTLYCTVTVFTAKKYN